MHTATTEPESGFRLQSIDVTVPNKLTEDFNVLGPAKVFSLIRASGLKFQIS